MASLTAEAAARLFITLGAAAPSVRRHCERVSWLGAELAMELELPEQEVASIHLAGLVHDVGKLAIARYFHHDSTALSRAGVLLAQSHVHAGVRVLKASGFPDEVCTIVEQHHERLDSSGYPAGLKFPVLGARVLAVADVLEVMTSPGPYRAAYHPGEILFWLRTSNGQYDAEVVEAARVFVRRFGGIYKLTMLKKILIADEDESVRALLAAAINTEPDYFVLEAKTGGEALEIAQQERPDLVLLDVMLAHVNGLEVCRRLKSDPTTKGTKVIMLTARAQDSEKKAGLGAGADDYLTKPFSPSELAATVRDVLNDTPARDRPTHV